MKPRFRTPTPCVVLVFVAAMLFPADRLSASCCGSGGELGGTHPEPASRMIGPLNKPLQVEVANISSGAQPVSFGGIPVTVPPGSHPVSYGGTGSVFAPQPGEAHEFSGNGQAGIKEQTCPPAPVGSGATAEGVNTDPTQRHGSPSVDSNLDKAGTSRAGKVFGTDNVSPSPMDRLGGTGSTLTPPAANYSASLGETFDPQRGRSGVAATLLPDGAILFDPSNKDRYAIRGIDPSISTLTDTTNGSVRTISITGSGLVQPSTTTLTQAANVLTIRYYEYDPHSGLPLPAPIKTTVIERHLDAPDPDNGYSHGYTFTVAYLDGETNATQVWTSHPQTSTTLAKTKVVSGIESREWVSTFSGGQRTVTFHRSINGVLVRKTIDTYSAAPWSNGKEILTQSAVVVAGGNLTTTYTYWNNPYDLNHTRLQRVTYPDGSWVMSAMSSSVTTLTVRPYGSAPPLTISPTSGSPAYELAIAASSTYLYTYTSEYTTLTSPNLGLTSTSGRLLSYQRSIGTTIVEKKVRPAGAPDVLETWNGADRLYTSDAGWKSYNSSDGSTELVTMTGRLNQHPSSGDSIDRTVTSEQPVGNGGVRRVTTLRKADSQSPDSFVEMSWSDQVDGRPLLAKKYLNPGTGEVLIELTEWVYESGGARRPLARKVNGVEVEAWAYPPHSPAGGSGGQTRPGRHHHGHRIRRRRPSRPPNAPRGRGRHRLWRIRRRAARHRHHLDLHRVRSSQPVPARIYRFRERPAGWCAPTRDHQPL